MGMAILLLPVVAVAQMTSASYGITSDSLTSGGGIMESANYQIRGHVGDLAPGSSESTTYQILAGYEAGIYDEIMEFKVWGVSPETEVAALSFNSGTGVLTLTSAKSYVVDSAQVVIFENKGSDNEEVFFAQVDDVSLGANTVTFDATPGADPAYVPSSGTGAQVNGILNVDGVNDIVYLLVEPAPGRTFGSLSSDEVTSQMYSFMTEGDDEAGYILYVAYADVEETLVDYPGVFDGHVEVGETEIGGRSSDQSVPGGTFDSEDTAITTTYQPFAYRIDGVRQSRDHFVLRMSVGEDQDEASYEGSLSFIAVGNF